MLLPLISRSEEFLSTIGHIEGLLRINVERDLTGFYLVRIYLPPLCLSVLSNPNNYLKGLDPKVMFGYVVLKFLPRQGSPKTLCREPLKLAFQGSLSLPCFYGLVTRNSYLTPNSKLYNDYFQPLMTLLV